MPSSAWPSDLSIHQSHSGSLLKDCGAHSNTSTGSRKSEWAKGAWLCSDVFGLPFPTFGASPTMFLVEGEWPSPSFHLVLPLWDQEEGLYRGGSCQGFWLTPEVSIPVTQGVLYPWTQGLHGFGSSGLTLCLPHVCQLFKGKFFVCQGEDTRNITNKSDCAEASYRWVRHKYNFDNLGQVSDRFEMGRSLKVGTHIHSSNVYQDSWRWATTEIGLLPAHCHHVPRASVTANPSKQTTEAYISPKMKG